MCTRFYVEPDTEEIREIIAEVQRSQLSGKFIKAGNAILTSGEIRPTKDTLYTIRIHHAKRTNRH